MSRPHEHASGHPRRPSAGRGALWLAAALVVLAACGGEGPGAPGPTTGPLLEAQGQALGGAPASKVLQVQWQGQQTTYWCGPGSTRIALSARVSPPSQTTLASYLGTTTNGTDHIGLVVNALNHYYGTSAFVGRNISEPPSEAQRAGLKQSLVATISNGYAFVANVVSGWRPPGYPGGTIYHYVAVVGYDQNGDRALIADPAANCSGGSGFCGVPSTYWVSTWDLGTWIGGKGYAATNLPIQPEATTGTLVGAIYQGGDTANRVAGAVVKVGDQTVTTGADGLYQFVLAPGSYTATVTKAGYRAASVTRAVTAGGKIWGSVELQPDGPVTPPDAQGPTFTLRSPADNAELDDARVEVEGSVSDDGGDIATVELVLNGAAPIAQAVSAGTFRHALLLRPGLNSLEVRARDAAGNLGKVVHTVVFNAGVAGRVHVEGSEALPVAGARVALLDRATGEPVAEGISDSAGAFALALEAVPLEVVLQVEATGHRTFRESLTVPEDRRVMRTVALALDSGDGRPQGEDGPGGLSGSGDDDGADALGRDVEGCTASGLGGLAPWLLASLLPLLRRRRRR